ncbi:hypothetical protein C8R47DRAFT_993915 [Mycena vitilis]|nr:hypothetical protein C8R47DRAFT_993915 [Mycena vitilis]
MQTATKSVISGSTIPALVASDIAFSPTDLDIYSPCRQGCNVVRFLRKGGKYRVVSVSDAYDFVAGIGKVWTLRHRTTRKKINIIESLSDRPLDSIAHFHSTCVFGAWTAQGLWHAYPHMTMQGLSMTTPTRLPLHDDLDHHKRVWKVLNKYHRRGFKFLLNEFPPPHICGDHITCPMTVRT